MSDKQMTPVDQKVEDCWNDFWKDIVCDKDGIIDIDQVKKELSDFSFLLDQVPKVYCHITGDKMSKVMYRAEDVIRVADDYFNERLKEALKDELEESGVNEAYQEAYNLGFEKGKEATAQPPAVKGAQWVKAHDYRPVGGIKTHYLPCRFVDSISEYRYSEMTVTWENDEMHFDITDHGESFPATDDYWNDTEVLVEHPTAAGDGKEVKEMLNWMLENEVERSTTGREGEEWVYPPTSDFYTTAQLYDIFKNRNNDGLRN